MNKWARSVAKLDNASRAWGRSDSAAWRGSPGAPRELNCYTDELLPGKLEERTGRQASRGSLEYPNRQLPRRRLLMFNRECADVVNKYKVSLKCEDSVAFGESHDEDISNLISRFTRIFFWSRVIHVWIWTCIRPVVALLTSEALQMIDVCSCSHDHLERRYHFAARCTVASVAEQSEREIQMLVFYWQFRYFCCLVRWRCCC